MGLVVDIPGRGRMALDHVVLDVNGTLTSRRQLIEGVPGRLRDVNATLALHLLSADTFGALEVVARELGISPRTVATGDDKARFVRELGAERCAAIGNGANDVAMLDAAALGIVVVGPEGAAAAAVRVADVVCRSILDALDLLLDERALVATLRL